MIMSKYAEALAFLNDPKRVTWAPGKEPTKEEKEAMARKAADSRYMMSTWFRLPRRYPR
jgi:hypothetical protein